MLNLLLFIIVAFVVFKLGYEYGLKGQSKFMDKTDTLLEKFRVKLRDWINKE
ncbi:MAG: hypothetical protein GX282_05145 [Campylobacteraceae bacterium]|nr:hypothetical protein [Campylobacteraceae bacterium]